MFSEYCKEADHVMSVYDLAALCCSYIARSVDDIEMFIGEYIMTDELSENCNPNFSELMKLQDDAYCLLIEKKGEEFSRILDEMLKLHDGLKLKAYLDRERLELTKAYFILLAVDRYIGSQSCLRKKGGPMNRGYVGSYYIYTKYEYSLLSHAKEELKFAPPIESRNLNSDLEHMIAVPKDIFSNFKEPMQMRCIPNKLKAALPEGKLRIAVIPFNGFKMMEFPKMEGSLISARYIENAEQKYIDRALIFLDRAMEESANIIIFP